MYKQFCKNLNHFINIMGFDDKAARVRNAEILLQLTDVEKYRENKKTNKDRYIYISNLIYDISQYSDQYPSLKRFLWELWAYGFDVEKRNEMVSRDYDADEIAKMTDLMLSTHYFPDS